MVLMQDHDDDDDGARTGTGIGGSSLSSSTLSASSASKTFAKLKEMGAEMKVGMTKLADKKVS